MPIHADYDPHNYRDITHSMGNLQAFICVLKASIGTGCLAMPLAFQHAGWANGILSTILIGFAVTYSLHILVRGMYVMCIRLHVPQLTFPQSVEFAMKDGPNCLRCLAVPTSIFVDLLLSFYHFGICCVYVIFIADNIKDVVDYYSIAVDSRFYMGLMALPLVFLLLIRNLKNLVPFNAIANILLVIGFDCIMYYLLFDLPSLKERPAFKSIDQWPFLYGTVLFAIESIGVMLAVEANMRNPKDFLGFNGLLVRSMIISMFFYTCMGLFGYWHYGNDVLASITLNLPNNDIISQIIKISLAIAIYFSYALQCYVTVDIIWNHYLLRAIEVHARRSMETVLRVSIVLATVLCAIIFPDLGPFLSLIGSSCLSMLGLYFPALMDLCVKHKVGYGPMQIYLILDILIMLIAIVGGAVGTWVSLADILVSYQNGIYSI